MNNFTSEKINMFCTEIATISVLTSTVLRGVEKVRYSQVWFDFACSTCCFLLGTESFCHTFILFKDFIWKIMFFLTLFMMQSNKTLLLAQLYSAQASLWFNLLFYCWISFRYLKFVKDYCFDVVSLYTGNKFESNSHVPELFCKVCHPLLMPMQAI